MLNIPLDICHIIHSFGLPLEFQAKKIRQWSLELEKSDKIRNISNIVCLHCENRFIIHIDESKNVNFGSISTHDGYFLVFDAHGDRIMKINTYTKRSILKWDPCPVPMKLCLCHNFLLINHHQNYKIDVYDSVSLKHLRTVTFEKSPVFFRFTASIGQSGELLFHLLRFRHLSPLNHISTYNDTGNLISNDIDNSVLYSDINSHPILKLDFMSTFEKWNVKYVRFDGFTVENSVVAQNKLTVSFMDLCDNSGGNNTSSSQIEIEGMVLSMVCSPIGKLFICHGERDLNELGGTHDTLQISVFE